MVQLELYIKEPINFLRTVTLKNKHFADHCLQHDVMPEFQDNFPDELNPYYRHLNGEYILREDSTVVNGKSYPNSRIYVKFDKMIYTKSLDTQEVIPFTKETLVQHPKTAALYRIPSDYYSKLCDSYPEQSDLIKAIVYPISSIEEAIAADNLTILACDEDMFQDNERMSIRMAIDKLLAMVKTRWWVNEFVYEDMYAITHQALLWHLMYLTIFGQRILNIKTSRAHQFHIWSYLNSKGISDHRDILTLDQSLFLYRNIDYLLKHKGTQSNFSILIGALLKPLGVSMYSKSIIQDCTTNVPSASSTATENKAIVLENLPKTFANTARPTANILSSQTGNTILIDQAAQLVSNRRHESYGEPIDITQKILSVDATQDRTTKDMELGNGFIENTELLYLKENDSALEYTEDNLFTRSTTKQDYQFAVTPHTFLTTKAHEINRDIGSSLYQQIYCRFVEESIFYRASENDLNYHIQVTAPNTKDVFSVTANQALALLLYCACRSVGIDLKEPPHEVELKWPYKKQFGEIPDTFSYCGKTLNTSYYLTAYGFDGMVAHPNKFSTPGDMCSVVHSQAVNFLTNYIETHRSPSSIRRELLLTVYQQRCVDGWVPLDLLGGMSYDDFFITTTGLDNVVLHYNASTDPAYMYAELYDELMKMFYPMDTVLLLESDNALHDKYSRIKELFISMCSYNITFLDDVEGMSQYCHTLSQVLFDNQKNIFTVGWPCMWIDPHMHFNPLINGRFRTDDEGHFIWPGFGDNMRVLMWILGRCDGTMDADEMQGQFSAGAVKRLLGCAA